MDVLSIRGQLDTRFRLANGPCKQWKVYASMLFESYLRALLLEFAFNMAKNLHVDPHFCEAKTFTQKPRDVKLDQ
tara:strand:- start:328 stop:552 length:225 start_codon:yes stop_codon:yes gene_type:complete